MDFLLASVHWHPHPVLQAILFGVEAAYLGGLQVRCPEAGRM